MSFPTGWSEISASGAAFERIPTAVAKLGYFRLRLISLKAFAFMGSDFFSRANENHAIVCPRGVHYNFLYLTSKWAFSVIFVRVEG